MVNFVFRSKSEVFWKVTNLCTFTTDLQIIKSHTFTSPLQTLLHIAWLQKPDSLFEKVYCGEMPRGCIWRHWLFFLPLVNTFREQVDANHQFVHSDVYLSAYFPK